MKYVAENGTIYSAKGDNIQIISADKENIGARSAGFLGYYPFEIAEKIKSAIAEGRIGSLKDIIEDIVNFPLLEPKTKLGGVVVFWENGHVRRSKLIASIE